MGGPVAPHEAQFPAQAIVGGGHLLRCLGQKFQASARGLLIVAFKSVQPRCACNEAKRNSYSLFFVGLSTLSLFLWFFTIFYGRSTAPGSLSHSRDSLPSPAAMAVAVSRHEVSSAMAKWG